MATTQLDCGFIMAVQATRPPSHRLQGPNDSKYRNSKHASNFAALSSFGVRDIQAGGEYVGRRFFYSTLYLRPVEYAAKSKKKTEPVTAVPVAHAGSELTVPSV
jgi:hypothetical protein